MGKVAVLFKKPYPHTVFFDASKKKGAGKSAHKKLTLPKARALLRGIQNMPAPRKGKRGGMSNAAKAKARATLKKKFSSL